jgi:hypothetical protein
VVSAGNAGDSHVATTVNTRESEPKPVNIDIELPDEAYEHLASRAENQGFDSPEAYASMVLQTVMDELAAPEEDDQVRDRLEDLGYL